MEGMPRARKPYVNLEIDRYGNKRWYFRKGKGKRYRLTGSYESNAHNYILQRFKPY